MTCGSLNWRRANSVARLAWTERFRAFALRRRCVTAADAPAAMLRPSPNAYPPPSLRLAVVRQTAPHPRQSKPTAVEGKRRRGETQHPRKRNPSSSLPKPSPTQQPRLRGEPSGVVKQPVSAPPQQSTPQVLAISAAPELQVCQGASEQAQSGCPWASWPSAPPPGHPNALSLSCLQHGALWAP